jgi:hypothetical protein
VLLTRARPDYSARAEAALVAGPRSSLSPVFRTSDLTVYAVPSPAPIVTGPAPARLLELAESRIVARVSAAGSYRVAIRFSRYWQPSTGCLERATDGMIRLVVRRPGVVRLKFSPTPRRALAALAGRPARSCGR